ncbi:MAG TPA: EAL domain-containing protein [Nitrospiria bacterium]|nr:EAL domain-containing protein [Nitrospiria bacterium]
MSKKTRKPSDAPRARTPRVKSAPNAIDKRFRESEQFNTQIIENVREGIILYDRQLRYLVWNPYMEELTGLRAEAVLGKRPRDLPSLYLEQDGKLLIEKKIAEGIEACVEKALTGETFAYMDIPVFIKKTGGTGWTSARYGPFRNDQGEVIGVIATVHDTTERIRAEEELRKSEEELRKILTNIEEIIYSVGIKEDPLVSTIQFMSPRTEDIVGYRPEEFIEDEGLWFRILHPEDVPTVTESTRKILEDRSTGIREYRLRHKETGEYRWVEDKVVPQVGETGKVVGFFGVARDITDRKRVEDRLKFSQFSIDRAGDAIYWLTPDARIFNVNELASRFLGYTREELLTMSVFDIDPDFPRENWSPVWSELKRRGSITLETRHRTKSGRIFPVEINANYLEFEGKEYNCAFARDISERVQAVAELEKSVSLLRATLESTADGIYVVDHEGRIVSFNQKFLKLWRIPESVVAAGDHKQPLSFVLDQLKDPDAFLKKVRSLYDQPDSESFDLLEFKDGRIFERYSQPHWIGGKSVGRVWSFRDVTDRRQAEEALFQSQKGLSDAQRIAHLGNWDWNIQTNELQWSDEINRIFGLSPQEFGATYEAFLNTVHPGDREFVTKSVDEALWKKRPYSIDHRIVLPSGAERIVHEQAEVTFDQAGKPIRMIGTVQDITERRKAEEALRKSEAQNRALLNAMPDMMFRINREGVYLDFIPAKGLEPFVPPNQFLGKEVREVLPPDVAEPFMHYTRQALETGETQVFEYPLLVKGGRRDYEARIVVSGTNEVLTIVRDITERKTQAAALEYQALHDTLTDLPNRTLVLDRLRQAIHSADREGRPLALLLMDLDHFKDVNDALGHHHGDLLLKQVGPRVLSVLRESDTVARLGGDEFAVLLPATDIDGATVAAQKILEALDRPFVVEGFFLEVGASIGIALFPEHGDDVDRLMRRADVAMYSAKQSSSGFAVYVSEHDRHSPSRLALMAEMRHAVERREFVLYYQPKIDLKTRQTTGVEALIRWRHPERGLIPPDEFITLAEHTGFIKQLTLWVLENALGQWRAWRRSGIDLSVAVNLSARSLQDPQLPDQITGLLQSSGALPAGLELEITESAIMADPARAMEILTRLRSKNIRFSIDDFGAGYSSLGYLKKLPVDEVKVDKSFVLGMAANADDAVIVRSTIDLAHNLGLKVVAEGVESREVLERLVEMGCDAAQGYYMSRPIPAEELARWLTDSPWGLKKARSHSTK